MKAAKQRDKRVLADAGCTLPVLPPGYFWKVGWDYGDRRVVSICSANPSRFNNNRVRAWYSAIQNDFNLVDPVMIVCHCAALCMQYMIRDCHTMALRRGRPTFDDLEGEYR